MTGTAKLDAEIAAYEQRLERAPRDDPSRRLPLLNNLAARLRARFGLTGDESDLERAVQACQEAIASIDPACPQAPVYLNSLGNCLADRFARYGLASDLDAAITAYQNAVDRSAERSPDAPAFKANLASALADRYRRDGAVRDLDHAITMVEQIWDCGTGDPAERAGLAANYGSMLQDRYMATGSLKDLERAIDVTRTALAGRPADAGSHTMLLTNLGGALQSRYERVNHREDLDAALEAFRAGLAETAAGSPSRALLLNNLGITLAARARIDGGASGVRDLTGAVAAHRSALQATLGADRAQRLDNLAAALSDRYQMAGRGRDLREALRIWRRSVAETAPHAPQRARRLGNLARGYALRFDRQRRRRDLLRARRLYQQSCVAGLTSDPESALAAGSEWGKWAIARMAYPEAAGAHDLAADALDQLIRAQLLRSDKEAWMRAAVGAASAGSFAHARAGDCTGAARAIERGRALLLSEALDRGRAELTRLGTLGRGDLAARYSEVSRRLSRLLDAGRGRP